MLKGSIWIVILSVALIGSFDARADGKVFSQSIVPTTIPDQRAMLHYADGRETLVIETSFKGSGTNFGWVIPFPAEPLIEKVSLEFFPILNHSFQPRLETGESQMWIVFAVLGGIASGSIAIYRRHRKSALVWLGWLVLSCLVLLIVSVPSFIKVRGSEASSVTILNRAVIGEFDVTTLSTSSATGLLAWLNENGFQASSNAVDVIEAYTRENWVFAALKLAGDHSTGGKAHPLSFTFHSERPVYPLRLTGVENEPCSIELFVFGPGLASCRYFSPEFCGRPVFDSDGALIVDRSDRSLFESPAPGDFRFGNPEIIARSRPASVVTKLTGTLGPEQMIEDAWVAWKPIRNMVPAYFTKAGRINAVLEWSVGIGAVGILCIQAFSALLSRTVRFRLVLSIAALSIVSGLIRFHSADVGKGKVVRGSAAYRQADFRNLDAALQGYLLERGADRPMTPEELLAGLKAQFAGSGPKNAFTAEPVRIHPSPGNLVIREASSGQEICWYDIHGRPLILAWIGANNGSTGSP